VAYAVENDIRRHLGRLEAGWPPPNAKPPTISDGLAFADTAQGEVDAILAGKGLMTPATQPASFVNLLRDLCAMYAAALIAAALFPQAAGPMSTSLQDFLMRQYRQGLADLDKGAVIPVGLTTMSGGALPRSFWTSHKDTVSTDLDSGAENDLEPVFRRDTRW
jgi:hypothetical protein